jgi:DinB superfamily
VTIVTEDERDAAAYAADIEAARDRLIAFASGCSEAQWRAAPLDGDPRPVAVVVDHVADSYEYLAGFIRQILAGQAAEVTGELVDDLNAEHAAAAAAVSQADAAEHLRHSGAAISALIASLSADRLAVADGRIRLFAQIAIRHADNHRTDIETALAAQGLRTA